MSLLLFTFLLAILLLYYFWRRYRNRYVQISQLSSRAVLITGCDSGFGRHLALRLLANRVRVFAGCLTDEGVRILVEMAFRPGESPKLTTLKIDVTNGDSLLEAKRKIKAELEEQDLWAIVCNAGVLGQVGPDDLLTEDDYKKCIEVNTMGTIRTCHTFKSMIYRSKGRIVIITSSAGRLAFPQMGPYVVSKFGLEGYASLLRFEIKPRGCSLHVVQPGFFRTNLTDNAVIAESYAKLWNDSAKHEKIEYGNRYCTEMIKMFNTKYRDLLSDDIEPVISAYWHALTSKYPKSRYVVGFDAKFIVNPLSCMPGDLLEYLAYKLNILPVPDFDNKDT